MWVILFYRYQVGFFLGNTVVLATVYLSITVSSTGNFSCCNWLGWSRFVAVPLLLIAWWNFHVLCRDERANKCWSRPASSVHCPHDTLYLLRLYYDILNLLSQLTVLFSQNNEGIFLNLKYSPCMDFTFLEMNAKSIFFLFVSGELTWFLSHS